MANTAGRIHYRVTLECLAGDSSTPVALVAFDTVASEVEVRGKLFPKDLELANAIVRLVKAFQKHGPDALGEMRGEVE